MANNRFKRDTIRPIQEYIERDFSERVQSDADFNTPYIPQPGTVRGNSQNLPRQSRIHTQVNGKITNSRAVYNVLPANTKKTYIAGSRIFTAAAGLIDGEEILGDPTTVPSGYVMICRVLTLFDLSGGVLTANAPVIGVSLLIDGIPLDGLTKIPIGVSESIPLYTVINENSNVSIITALKFDASPIALPANSKLGARLEVDLLPIGSGDYRSAIFKG